MYFPLFRCATISRGGYYMNLNEILFLIHFLVVVAITLYKVYNLFNMGQKYPLAVGFSLFAIFGIAYFVGLIITLTDYSSSTYSILLYLESLLFLPGQIFFIIFEMIMQHSANMDNIYMPYMGKDK